MATPGEIRIALDLLYEKQRAASTLRELPPELLPEIFAALAGALGAAIPLTLKALKQDPAVGSGVFVTTLTDIFGFAVFLGIASALIERLT